MKEKINFVSDYVKYYNIIKMVIRRAKKVKNLLSWFGIMVYGGVIMKINRDKVLMVSQMQEYIHHNIRKKISLKELATHVNYSPWYCARVFSEVMHKSPFEYIRLLKLTNAALRLRDYEDKIIDVAFDHHFASHEGFTRAFAKEFGLTPRKYAKETPPINLFIPNRIYDQYHELMKEGKKLAKELTTKAVFVQVVERPARKLILKRGIKASHYFEYCEEVDCDNVWGILESIKEALYEPVGLWLPKNLRTKGTSEYAQGVEVSIDYDGKIPQGFDIIELPACKLMVFQGEPYNDDNFREEVGAVMDAVSRYNPESFGFKWADKLAPRIQLRPLGYRGYIEAKPVVSI